jgi:hypothetical protein
MSQMGSTKRTSILAMAALVAMALGSGNPSAQTVEGGNRVPSFTKLPDSAIAQFKANPQTLLTTYASAGLPLSTEVRSLVLTDPGVVDALIDVAKNGNDAQKAAMGAGLAEAARILAATNPQLAARIQLAVAKAGCDPSGPAKPDCASLAPFVTAFIAGSNGIRTAAIGGGAGGGGGGLGGGSGGPAGGVGNSGGSNSGSNPGGFSFGTLNSGSGFGALGAGGGAGGGLITPSTSPAGG